MQFVPHRYMALKIRPTFLVSAPLVPLYNRTDVQKCFLVLIKWCIDVKVLYFSVSKTQKVFVKNKPAGIDCKNIYNGAPKSSKKAGLLCSLY